MVGRPALVFQESSPARLAAAVHARHERATTEQRAATRLPGEGVRIRLASRASSCQTDANAALLILMQCPSCSHLPCALCRARLSEASAQLFPDDPASGSTANRSSELRTRDAAALRGTLLSKAADAASGTGATGWSLSNATLQLPIEKSKPQSPRTRDGRLSRYRRGSINYDAASRDGGVDNEGVQSCEGHIRKRKAAEVTLRAADDDDV